METEQIIMKLIVHGGDARAHSLKAIQAAEQDNFVEAQALLEQANNSLNKAHAAQTEVIQQEVCGEKTEVSLLMVHAQDHVMNAMTIKDLAEHIIKNRQEIYYLNQSINNLGMERIR